MCLVETLPIGIGDVIGEMAGKDKVEILALESRLPINQTAIEILALIVSTHLEPQFHGRKVLCMSRLHQKSCYS